VNRTAQRARTSGVNASPMWSWNDGSPRSNVVPESQNQSFSATAMSTQMFLCYREDFPLTAAGHPRETLVLGLDYRDTDTTVRPIRFAIRVGAQWFVSDATFTPPAGTTTSPFTRLTLDLATAPLWRSLAFTPGSTLALGALATPPAGDITAFGWFGDAGFSSGGVNWDNFTIAKPEPLAAQATASATLLTGFQTWAQSYGLPTDGTGLGAPLATPANDGIANLLKHGLGLNPHTPGWGGRYATGEVTTGGKRYLAITFTRPEPPAAGVTLTAESAGTLAPAAWNPATTVIHESMTNGDGTATITVRDTVAMEDDDTRFLHLRATATTP